MEFTNKVKAGTSAKRQEFELVYGLDELSEAEALLSFPPARPSNFKLQSPAVSAGGTPAFVFVEKEEELEAEADDDSDVDSTTPDNANVTLNDTNDNDIESITAEVNQLILQSNEELANLQEQLELTKKRKSDIETSLEASVANQKYTEAAELKTLLEQAEIDVSYLEEQIKLGGEKKELHEFRKVKIEQDDLLQKMKVEQDNLLQSLDNGSATAEVLMEISFNSVRCELDKIVLENKTILTEAFCFF